MAMDKTIWKCIVLCMVFIGSCFMTSDFCKRITVHTDKKSWLDARSDCENSSQMLLNASHISELYSCNGSYKDYWIDKYNYLSNWMEIYGCYTWVNNSLNGLQSTKSYLTPAICDRACQSEFFGTKKEECICINNTMKEQYLSNTSSSHCVTPCRLDTHLYCGGEQALNLYRRVPSGDVKKQSNDKSCSSLECQRAIIGLIARKCSDPLQILCGDGNLQVEYKSWIDQLAYCRTRNNTAYKFDGNPMVFCNKMGTSPSWSGVFRSVINESSKWFPFDHSNIQCFKLKEESNDYTTEKSKCTDERQYICVGDPSSIHSTTTRIIGSSFQRETTIDISTKATTYNSYNNSNVSEITDPSSTHTTTTAAGVTTVISGTSFKSEKTLHTSTSATTSTNHSNADSQMSANSGVIAGSVIGVIVVIACVLLVILVIRKRGIVFRCLCSKDEEKEEKNLNLVGDGMRKAEVKNNEETDNHIYTETVNQEYEFAKPYDIIKNQGYELAQPFDNSEGSNGDPSRNDYEFAAVIKDDDYVYTDTKEGEYDTFQNKEKRKIRVDEGNLYSHTTAGLGTDSDYDTTYGTKVNDTSDIYDHTKV